ncbi:MAG TPA: DNA methyltransferase [Blastocatellia bacterium]|nr:DNA methyltransferase [Blastocatellia bacterium]
MAHWSEGCKRLSTATLEIGSLSQLNGIKPAAPGVYLFCLPFPRTHSDGAASAETFLKLAACAENLGATDTVCVLTTAPDAALLLPYLEKVMRFQLWVAVKTPADAYPSHAGALPNRHLALLVFTRYKAVLRHTKTRVQYTYCPVCGRTTKDYGGKKHTYHEYGTLLSDVWRDIECNPNQDLTPVADRLCDLFGLESYGDLSIIDMRKCRELLPMRLEETIKAPGKGAAKRKQNVAAISNRLLNDDCLNALQAIQDDSVDFCFADPPYNLKKKYDKWDDALESVEYFSWCDRWLSELCRVLKPGRTLAVLNIPLWAARHYQHLSKIMDFQAWIAWDGLSFPVRMIMPAHYAILCFSKGNARPLPGLSDSGLTPSEMDFLKPLKEFYCLRSHCVSLRERLGKDDRSEVSDLWHDVHRLKHNSRRVDHPCQLPPLLMRRLFSLFTNPGELILDCFNGAGTSTLVAQQMKRRFIGIELSSQYHEIAVRRHEQLDYGEDPFGKSDGVPDAKNSPVQRLPKQRYAVSKKELQLDVRRIAHELNRLPTREEVQRLSKFPFHYFEKYFVSWGEVCAAARTTGMSELPARMEKEGSGDQLELLFARGQDS